MQDVLFGNGLSVKLEEEPQVIRLIRLYCVSTVGGRMRSRIEPLAATIALISSIVTAASTDASAQATKPVERYRADLIRQVETAQAVPDQLKNFATAVLKDDSLPLSESDAFSAASAVAGDVEVETRRQVYMFLWIFRNRSDGARIASFYDELPLDHRDFFATLVAQLNADYIDESYHVLAENALNDAIDRTLLADLSAGTLQQRSEAVLRAARLLLATHSSTAVSTIDGLVRSRVANADLRFNLVSALATQAKRDALPTVQWYFQNYAFKAFELRALCKYLRTFAEDPTVDSLVSQKQRALEESLRSIHDDVGDATEPISAPSEP